MGAESPVFRRHPPRLLLATAQPFKPDLSTGSLLDLYLCQVELGKEHTLGWRWVGWRTLRPEPGEQDVSKTNSGSLGRGASGDIDHNNSTRHRVAGSSCGRWEEAQADGHGLKQH
jgi:hypothetical protein